MPETLGRKNGIQFQLATLVSLLLVGTKFKIHDLVGINFSDFIISSSDTYQVLSGFPKVSSNDELS